MYLSPTLNYQLYKIASVNTWRPTGDQFVKWAAYNADERNWSEDLPQKMPVWQPSLQKMPVRQPSPPELPVWGGNPKRLSRFLRGNNAYQAS